MVLLKYAPAVAFALFIAIALLGYSVTGADGAFLFGLAMGMALGSWIAKSVEPKLMHFELRRRLRRTRK